jgi:YihY family inner membrane protein
MLPHRKPEQPSDIDKSGWKGVVKRTLKGYKDDNLGDWASALTYYSVLSIFPALLVIVSLLKFTGPHETDKLIANLAGAAPSNVRDILTNTVHGLQRGHGSTAGILAVVGLLAALWSASGYIGAFMRASNAIYDIGEGRPVYKTIPTQLTLTIVTLVLLTASALAVVATGSVASALGSMVGAGHTAVTVWNYAKWPVLLGVVSFLFALLYWAAPNAKQGFQWLTPGGISAVLIWVAASALFAFYVANFGSYNKTYGSLGGVIVFLIWLRISNMAILLGAEMNAELARQRAIASGQPEDKEPYVELRDTHNLKPKADLSS